MVFTTKNSIFKSTSMGLICSIYTSVLLGLGYITLGNLNVISENFNIDTYINDAPRAWGLYFQDSASPQMEAIVELHNNIMYFLAVILFGVSWILLSVVRNFIKSKLPISNKYLNHGTLIELIWTITPALILILIAFPSFKLLFLIDDVTDPHISLGVKSHQWYWSYQYADFTNNQDIVFFSDSESSASSSASSRAGSIHVAQGGDPDDSDSGSDSNECQHNVQGHCGQCIDIMHKVAIGNCTHSWDLLDHNNNAGFLGSVCDLDTTTCTNIVGESSYHCNSCNAISCGNCVEGFETYPDSEHSSDASDN